MLCVRVKLTKISNGQASSYGHLDRAQSVYESWAPSWSWEESVLLGAEKSKTKTSDVTVV